MNTSNSTIDPHEHGAAKFLLGLFIGALSAVGVLTTVNAEPRVEAGGSAPAPEIEPVSVTYVERVMRAVDQTQHAAWTVANYCPTDGVMRWYEDVTADLQSIECELRPQECR